MEYKIYNASLQISKPPYEINNDDMKKDINLFQNEWKNKMKVKRLKKLIKNVSDDTEVYFMFGLNDKYEDKENGIFTLKENGESSYFENKLIFTLKEVKEND